MDSFLKKRMRKTAAEGFKNFAADGICLQIVADAKYAGDRRRAPQEGAALLDAATLRKVSCLNSVYLRNSLILLEVLLVKKIFIKRNLLCHMMLMSIFLG